MDADELIRRYPPEHFRQAVARLTRTSEQSTTQMRRPSKETIDEAIRRTRQGQRLLP